MKFDLEKFISDLILWSLTGIGYVSLTTVGFLILYSPAIYYDYYQEHLSIKPLYYTHNCKLIYSAYTIVLLIIILFIVMIKGLYNVNKDEIKKFLKDYKY